VFGTEWIEPVATGGTAMWSALLAAPFVGSFLGVLVRRLPDRLPVAWSRSRCEWCGAALRAGDLVPLYSWLAARGRCRYCGHSLGWFYPGIEVAAVTVPLSAAIIDHGAGMLRLPAGLVASRSRLDRYPPMAAPRPADPAARCRRLSPRRCSIGRLTDTRSVPPWAI
jgi:hypothetical protein